MLTTKSSDREQTVEPAGKTQVVIQGYLGAFHEIAAHLYYGEESIGIVPAETFEDLVRNQVDLPLVLEGSKTSASVK